MGDLRNDQSGGGRHAGMCAVGLSGGRQGRVQAGAARFGTFVCNAFGSILAALVAA
jgi:hypothetical protein